MFLKDWRIGLLLDFYGEILNERTRSILARYYDNDLSLAEIAESEGISRQGIRHILKKGEEQLFFFEEKLGLFAEYTALREHAEALLSLADSLEGEADPRLSAIAAHTKEAAALILSHDDEGVTPSGEK